MKFKGSYQKSILEGLQLNNCTSYKKHYRNRQMDNEQIATKYEQKRDGLSPMKISSLIDKKAKKNFQPDELIKL